MVTIATRHIVGTERSALTARRLYDAEVQLHIARQTHVDVWIAAAYDKLHVAIREHLAATGAAAARLAVAAS
jgi:hypothetical protein